MRLQWTCSGWWRPMRTLSHTTRYAAEPLEQPNLFIPGLTLLSPCRASPCRAHTVFGPLSCGEQLSALMADLETAYRSGKMSGGSFRQCSQVRIAHDKIVAKLSKLDEEHHVVIAFCGAPKRDATSKKVAKYNEKNGNRILIAWAAKDAPYPVDEKEATASAERAVAAIDVSDDAVSATAGGAEPAAAGATVAHSFEVRLEEPLLAAAGEKAPAREAATRAAEGLAQWLFAHWAPTTQRKHPDVRLELKAQSHVLVSSTTAAAASSPTDVQAFEDDWRKAISAAVKKVEVDDLGSMDAQALFESIPETDDNGRGLQDMRKLESELSVKVVFCAPPCKHVLLVGAKAKLAKKCFVLRNLLSHYHWRLSGRDVAFDAMTATK